jgi:hypothetical protein
MNRYDDPRLTDYLLVLAGALILFIPIIVYFLESN